jgi:hypothetical protein
MNKIFFVEDILLEFCRLHLMHGFISNYNDYKVLTNFQMIIENKESLTQNQGNLLVRLLKKYASVSRNYNFNYDNEIDPPQWRTSFRVLDLTKAVFLKKDKDGQMYICLKFPFQLKENFDKTFPSDEVYQHRGYWDPEEKIRKIVLDGTNVIHLYEWCKKNSFEFDQEFLDLVLLVENLWSDQDKILPHSVIFEDSVVLINGTENADNFFEELSTGNLYDDLLLSKSMGFPIKLEKSPKNLVEKIASSKDNIFWIKEIERFFELTEKISGKIVILIDRASERNAWLKNFVKISENFPREREKIKVCFRDDKHETGNFNQWIREQALGGSVGEGKYLIFENKPAKWLFKDNIDVKIIVTNNLYMNSNAWVNDWMTSHPCVIYLSEVKPILKRIRNIATL